MFDLDAEIIPGVSAAGITLGQPIAPVLRFRQPDAIEQRIGVRVLKYGAVWLFEPDGEGVVSQVCIFAGYRGKVSGSIGIGSRICEIEAAFGSLEHIMGNEYQIDRGTPWLNNDWCFTLEKGSPSIGEPGWGEARIDCICT